MYERMIKFAQQSVNLSAGKEEAQADDETADDAEKGGQECCAQHCPGADELQDEGGCGHCQHGDEFPPAALPAGDGQGQRQQGSGVSGRFVSFFSLSAHFPSMHSAKKHQKNIRVSCPVYRFHPIQHKKHPERALPSGVSFICITP